MDQLTDENPYKSPLFSNIAKKKTSEKRLNHDRIIRNALYWAFGESLFFMFLDVGELAWLWVVALITWWATIVLILLRYKFGQSHIISRWDIVIIKFSVWPVLILIFVYAMVRG